MEHDEGCWHCRIGCDHPHSYDEPVAALGFTQCGRGIPGSRVPDGPATLTDFRSGLTIAANEWVRVRCMSCGFELRAPSVIIPPFCPTDRDGTKLLFCGACVLDTGHPEYN